MLDEPSLGLSPIFASEIFQTIKELNNRDITVLLISQEVLQTLTISNYAYVMENGKIVLKGAAKDLLDDPRIKESYLGL